MKKKELLKCQDYARILYFNDESQDVIAERVGVSKQTISKWVNTLHWKERRAAMQITRPELVNKMLAACSDLLDRATESNDPKVLIKLPDALAKFASCIEKIDKKANAVTEIETFMAFNSWLDQRRKTDREVTPELMAKINKYQDLYLSREIK